MASQRDLTLLAAGFAVALGMVATYHLGRAHADGIPATDTMYFGGTLDENGVLVTGTRDVTVRLYDAESGGTPLCETAAPAAPLQAGRFRIALNARCTTAVRDNANVWSQLTVGTTTIAGRSRLGAVPCAVEAQRADGLTPAGLAQVAPVRTFYAAGTFTRASGEGVWVPINQLRVSFTATTTATAEIFSLLNVYGEMGATRCCIRYILDGVEIGGGGEEGCVGVNRVNTSPSDVANLVGLRSVAVTSGAHVVTVEGAKAAGVYSGTTCVFAGEGNRLRVQVQ